MEVFRVIWKIIKWFSGITGVVGIVGIFADIDKWGSLMNTLAPYITTPYFQSLSVVLIVLLIVDTTLKHQHKISFLNSDLMSMMRNALKQLKTIKPNLTPVNYQPTYEQDFDEFAKHKGAGTTPELQPDAYMSDAINHLKDILFPNRDPQHLDYQFEIPTAVNEITAKLRTGELKSWGLYTGESVPRVLNRDVWEFRELIPESASRELEKKDPQTRSVINDTNQHQLTGLRVNINQVKSLWRRAGKEPVKEVKSDKHNVSLLEAIHYVASGKWSNVHKLVGSETVLVDDDEIDRIDRAWRDLEQAAIDGDIRIWGENSRSHWILITDNTYWKRHWINWMQIMTADEENDWGLNEIIGVDVNDRSKKDELYHKYNTSKQDIEKLWQ